MPAFFLFSVEALVLLSLCSAVFSLPNQPRARRIELKGAQDVDKRDICYDDDTFLSFKTYILDSAPYCSSLLGIEDFTSTVLSTSRTTTRELRTSITNTVTTTATRASVTVFSTVYDPNLQKRNYPAPTSAPFYQDNPYAYSVIANDVNASIASSYFSACSCLRLTPSTVGSVTLTSSTRTISGVDFQQATETVYVTTGTSTQILTRAGNPNTITVSSTVVVIPTELPTTNITVPIPLSTVYSSVGTSSPSGSLPSASFNVSFALSTTIDATRPTIAPTLNLTSLSVPSVTSPVSINSTTSIPTVTGPSYPAANLTSTYLASSGLPTVSSGFPSSLGNLSTSLRPVSGLPTPSTNMTSTFRPTSAAPFPSTNLTVSSLPSSGFPTITPANLTITSRVTSGLPTPSANSSSFVVPSFPVSGTVTVTSFGPTVTSPGETLSYPYPQNFTSFVTQPANTVTVSAISIPGNTETISNPPPTSTISSPGTLIPAPSTAPVLNINNCPSLNGTEVVLSDGQRYAVVCETEFSGPINVGLQERTFQDCIEDCGTANNGFSAIRCRGVTYSPNRLTGPNCFLKTAAALMVAMHNEFTVSAVLINYNALNATVSPSFMLPIATLESGLVVRP